MAIDARGRLLVTETHRLLVMTTAGEMLQQLPLRDCGALGGVAAGPTHVFLCATSFNTIHVMETL